jgi:hypothetical protein
MGYLLPWAHDVMYGRVHLRRVGSTSRDCHVLFAIFVRSDCGRLGPNIQQHKPTPPPRLDERRCAGESRSDAKVFHRASSGAVTVETRANRPTSFPRARGRRASYAGLKAAEDPRRIRRPSPADRYVSPLAIDVSTTGLVPARSSAMKLPIHPEGDSDRIAV